MRLGINSVIYFQKDPVKFQIRKFLIMLKYRYLFMLHSQICLLYMWVTNLSSFPTFNQ